MKEHTGSLLGKGLHIAIVVSRFNELISNSLLEGALDGLYRHGVEDSHITLARVPGAFEIPLIASQMAKSHNYHAVICLGAIIRGATAHFDIIASQMASGIMNASLESSVPVLLGVLTTDSIEQALERAGTKFGNKGFDTALAAIEMANLMKTITST